MAPCFCYKCDEPKDILTDKRDLCDVEMEVLSNYCDLECLTQYKHSV
jgi:hypothetical protein